MTFVLRMAGRELRASWRRLAFFFLCVAVGVGAIVALRSVIQSVGAAMTAETRALTAADILITSEQPWSDEARAVIDEALASEPELARTSSIETATMARPADETKTVAKVVELRGVEAAFPFYGEFVLQDDVPYRHDLLAGGGALVRPELLTQLDVTVGEEIVIGEGMFEIRGVIVREAGGQLGAFSFGPRVLVDHDDLLATGLLGFGTRADRQLLLRVPEARIEPLVERLREPLRDLFIRVRSYRRTEDRIAANMRRAENYLSLIGFVVVILGGIGVWSVTRVFVQQRIRSVAILKCLGATSRQVLAIYVVQVVALGLGGSLLGVALAGGALAAIPASLVGQAATAAGLGDLAYGLTVSAVAQGVGVGVVVSLLFALGPLLEMRAIKPLALLRWGIVTNPVRDWVQFAAVALLTAGLVVLASWQAASWEAGFWVCGGFAVVAFVLHLVGQGLVKAIQPLGQEARFALRHAVLNLARPGNQTRVVLLAVGLGSFFIIGIHAVQANLLGAFALELGDDTPDMFLIDIQQDQVDGVSALLDERVGAVPDLLPVLRARVTGVTGQRTTLESAREVRRRGVGREYTVTYRDHLEANERVVAGAFWEPRESERAEVSVEVSVRDRLDLEIGDTMRFDILGREVAATVSSVRMVEWDDSRSGGFMFLFRPGVLEQAPHSFIAFMQGPAETVARARLQRDLVAGFPNVSIIDGLEVIATVRRILDYVTVAITIVGGIALLSGVLILVGSVAMTKFQRLYETAIFKTLGATTRTIVLMLVFEYGTLGTLAGLVGSVGALALTWGLTRFLLEITWNPAPLTNIVGLVITALVVGVVGVVASLDVLRKKPLSTLRAE
ncbi:MAG: FtsX-like permease family protein [Vicinamibacterales bacterium]|nr:FtsX-like permease family protein [Vicinamibacterales bacterium]